MRIVGGKYRGKKLWSPDGKLVRPTAERAREAVFNILYSYWQGEYENFDMADIFAGTGAFGLEAVSRGFRSATFVDIEPKTVQRNAELFPAEQEKFFIIKANALNLPRLPRQFKLIFMDAPYNKGLSEKVLAELIAKNWLADDALCIVEVQENENLMLPPELQIADIRRYGLAKILFLQKQVKKGI